MLTEINEIKKWLADNLGLRIDGSGMDLRIVGKVPDGKYMIPLGTRKILHPVTIANDRIHVGDPR